MKMENDANQQVDPISVIMPVGAPSQSGDARSVRLLERL